MMANVSIVKEAAKAAWAYGVIRAPQTLIYHPHLDHLIWCLGRPKKACKCPSGLLCRLWHPTPQEAIFLGLEPAWRLALEMRGRNHASCCMISRWSADDPGPPPLLPSSSSSAAADAAANADADAICRSKAFFSSNTIVTIQGTSKQVFLFFPICHTAWNEKVY